MIAGSYLLAAVHQKWKWKLVVRPELRMLLRAGGIHAENNGVLLLSECPTIPKFAKLFGANHRFISRVEDQNDILAAQAGERNGISGLIGKGKVRRRIANAEWFGEQPGEHNITLFHPALFHPAADERG
jgi:hypothetical protein